ncbi:hypothetical protein KR018_009864, partial [Drosophila ironensis]
LSSNSLQLLQTGVSLIVDDGKGSSGDGSGSGSGSGSGGLTHRRRPVQLSATRKRKRRPQLPLATMGATEEENAGGSGSGSGSDAGSSYWRGHVEDDAEALRRRKPQAASPSQDREKQDAPGQGSSASKAYRRPYGQAKKESSSGAVETPATSGKTSVDLKNILKNSGGLSLSEILQQKNLSLDDLLKGKQNALLALQTTAVAPPATTTYTSGGSLGESLGKKTSGAGGYQPNKQGVRRLPAGYSNGHEEDKDRDKNKAKFPSALQRLKLFGSSSRESSTAGRRPSSTTTAPPTVTSTAASTTTRIPLYKKRQHLRSTLKPPGLFKAIGSSTSTTPTPVTTTQQQEAETSTGYSSSTHSTTTTLAYNLDQSEELQDKSEEQSEGEINEGFEGEEPEHQALDSSEAESGETHLHTEPPSPPSEILAAPSDTPLSPTFGSGNPRYRLRNSSIKENTKRLKDNVIVESGEDVDVNTSTTEAPSSPPPPPSPPSPPRSSEELSYGDDDLENFFDEVESHTHHTRVPAPEPPVPSPSLEPVPTKVKPAPAAVPAQLNLIVDDVDDRTDLLELIEDRRSGNRLFKVLEQRNMTLEELIEHRKRGSSQLHLSTIVSGDEHSRLYPGQKVILQDNMDIVTAFENFPHFNLMDLKSVKPDEIKTDSQGSSYFTSIIDIEPNDEANGGAGSGGRAAGSRGPTYAQTAVSSSSSAGGTITINQRGEKSLGFFPSWKTLALASLATATEDRNPYFLPPPRLLLDSQEQSSNSDALPDSGAGEPGASIDIDLSVSPYGSSGNFSTLDNARLPINNDVIDEIENEVARAHDLLDLELSGPGFHRSPAAAAATSAVSQQHLSGLYASMPSGIRSALVASTAIVVTALATFLVVFVVCRWKQQRRRKSSYLRTYNAMKSKLPQMPPRASNSNTGASMRQHMEEMAIGAGTGTGRAAKNRSDHGPGISSISTSVACCTPVHQLQRQSSLLFSRDGGATLSTATSLTTSTGVSASASASGSALALASSPGAAALVTATSPPGGAALESGLSGRGLAISLRSAHQRLNTMDPNSPEVQEYLFDTLRKSFDN